MGRRFETSDSVCCISAIAHFITDMLIFKTNWSELPIFNKRRRKKMEVWIHNSTYLASWLGRGRYSNTAGNLLICFICTEIQVFLQPCH